MSNFPLPALVATFVAVIRPADAAPCADFADVSDTSSFCSSVQWIKNRGVTLGCSPGLYCPDGDVTRAQMALFLSRLGAAMEPRFRYRSEQGLQERWNAGDVVCRTTPYAVAGYGRTATAQASLSGYGGTDRYGLQAQLMASIDEGASWQPIGERMESSPHSGTGWRLGMSLFAEPGAYAPGTTVTFGIHAFTFSEFEMAKCQLLVRLESRTDPGSISDD